MRVITEDTRSQLLSRARGAQREKGDGKTRYEKRMKSRVATHVRQFDKIDMNKLFKEGILDVEVQVQGETDDYTVSVSFGDFLGHVHKQLERNRQQQADLRTYTTALLSAFDTDDVYIHCSCLHPDTEIVLADGSSLTAEQLCARYRRGERLAVVSADRQGRP